MAAPPQKIGDLGMDCYWLDHINIYKRMLQSSNDWRFWSILVIFLLVGGSEHEFYFPFHI
jgi:hypothetical protein